MSSMGEGPRRPGRSILAVFLGVVVNFLATPLDGVLHAVGYFSSAATSLTHEQAGVAISYRLFLAILGGAVTARLAPRRPMGHAMILAAVGTVFSTAGAVVMLGVKHYGPAWYALALIAVCFPLSWLGARIQKRP